MKIAAIAFASLALIGCSPSQEQKARQEVHQTAEEAKKDAKVVLQKAEVGAKKAGREIDEGLDKTRKKVRDAMK